jgi:hypothetical protein
MSTIVYVLSCAEADVDQLMTALSDYATNIAPKGVLEVSRGQMCLAHFCTDDAWYRARVLEVTDYDIKVRDN